MAVKTADLSGLACEWDSVAEIRERLREGHPLVVSGDINIKKAVEAKPLLMPLLQRMAVNEEKKMPEIEHLRESIKEVYTMNKHDRASWEVQGDSWQVRKLLGLIKLKIRKADVSTETKQH